MTKTIRQNVFETNSSSSHSCTISDNPTSYVTIVPDDEGKIYLEGGEFGWGYDEYSDALTKANYCAVAATYGIFKDKKDMLISLLQEQTGAKLIVFAFETESYSSANNSYIDHQSIEDTACAAGDIFETKETLKNFIFNRQSRLVIDNDNH
jgi:hypothetical protein